MGSKQQPAKLHLPVQRVACLAPTAATRLDMRILQWILQPLLCALYLRIQQFELRWRSFALSAGGWHVQGPLRSANGLHLLRLLLCTMF